MTEHRTGVAPATVTIKAAFGDTHKGGPTQPVPSSGTRQIDAPILGNEHLNAASALVETARKIAELVHGAKQVSIPATY